MQASGMTSSAALARPLGSQPASRRMFYLDTLRVVLTVLVVLHHIGQAYGPTGGAWPVQEATRAAVLGPFFTVNRSFFMSLFFMISGFLAVGALERHGFSRFVRSRLVRLGIPVLVFGLIGMVVYLAWEELVAFGFCIGLLVAFRQFASRKGRFAGMLAANQYSVYFWHVGIAVVIQMAVRALSLSPLAKFGLVSLVAVPLVFLWSALMRKIPAVRAVL